jgi:dolichyl-phosphate-mannose-protein mannosyltransferase
MNFNMPDCLQPNPERKRHLYLFFFFLSIYVFTGQGSIQSADGKIMYLLTQSMVENHSLSFTERVGEGDPEGEKYSKYGIGMSVLATPFYLAGKALSAVLPVPPSYATLFCVSMINAFISALTCLLIYRFGRERFAFSHRTSVLLAVGYGLSTIAWFYSEGFMSEPATSLFLLAAVFFVTKRDAGQKNRNLSLAGVFLGLALTCRLATLVTVPGFLLYLMLDRDQAPYWKIKGLAMDTARFLIPVAGFICLIFLYNYARFGNIFETGYEKGFGSEGWTGLLGILFSPGKSVFLYNPLLIVGCLAVPAFIKSQSKMAGLFGWIVLVHLLLFSFWHSWYGGFGWGPRLMLVTLPYLILPVGFLLQRAKGKSRAGIVAIMIAGICIQVSSVTVNISRYYYDLRHQYQDRAHELLLYSPAHSPLIGQVRQVGKVFAQLGDKEFVDRLVTQALAGTRFLGASDAEVLEKGLAVNAPNFWWVFMILFGYSFWFTYFPAIVLLSISLFCGYKLFQTQE